MPVGNIVLAMCGSKSFVSNSVSNSAYCRYVTGCIVDYFSIKKELKFSYADIDEINKADSIKITVRKGELGFDVLEDYNVLK